MKQKTVRITEILVMPVFVLLALSTVLVVLMGTGSYRKLVSGGTVRYENRTAVRYLTTRIRQAESLRVESFGDSESLVLEEIIDGGCYVTRVYWYEGALRELFCEDNGLFLPEDGEMILEMTEPVVFSLEQESLMAEINGQELILSLRGKGWTP